MPVFIFVGVVSVFVRDCVCLLVCVNYGWCSFVFECLCLCVRPIVIILIVFGCACFIAFDLNCCSGCIHVCSRLLVFVCCCLVLLAVVCN